MTYLGWLTYESKRPWSSNAGQFGRVHTISAVAIMVTLDVVRSQWAYRVYEECFLIPRDFILSTSGKFLTYIYCYPPVPRDNQQLPKSSKYIHHVLEARVNIGVI